VQDRLERPLILENPSSYVRFAQSTIAEPDFLRALTQETGCGLLLDVNNVYVTCFNAGTDPFAYLDAFPCDRVVQMHLAGHQDLGSHLIDTHDRPVRPEVWELFRRAWARTGGAATLLEWDDQIPGFDDCLAELRKAELYMADGPVPLAAAHARRAAKADFQPGRLHRAARDGQHDRGCGVTALAAAQRRMHDALVFPGGDPAAAHALFAGDGRLGAAGGLAIYQRGYFLRIAACMRAQFPALCHALGRDLFDDFVADYIRDCPPDGTRSTISAAVFRTGWRRTGPMAPRARRGSIS
jgi:hypothetical protein